MDSKIYFLPHHAVMKGDSVSMKLLVVFDGTCKPSNRNSLNSILGIATRGLLATDHVILNHGQVTWTTPELAPPLLTTTPHQWRTFQLSTDLTCIAALHVWVGDSSNSEIHPDECCKAPGLTWNSMKYTFIFNLKVNFPDNITKRSFLSQSARLFDPLGFLAPCTVSTKIFYQQLWLLKLDWDSSLPEALETKWKTF
ncbi:uncharacterized protein TNCV_4170281 [Trichonephila clavipes]|nr:uncharacterized protein TNCV_4170281 [Trichonephila clavipes]